MAKVDFDYERFHEKCIEEAKAPEWGSSNLAQAAYMLGVTEVLVKLKKELEQSEYSKVGREDIIKQC